MNLVTRLILGLSLFVATPALAAPAPDLTGAWTPAADARPGPVKILDCFPNYNHYTITRGAGGRWDVKVRQIFHSGTPQPPLHEEHLQGIFAGGHLHLAGEAGLVQAPGVSSAKLLPAPRRTVYDLRLDAKTGHLVGTRDGASFRLARLVLVKPANGRDCGALP